MRLVSWWGGPSRRRRWLVAAIALVVVAGAVAGTVRALAGNPEPPAIPPADAGHPGDVLLVPGYGGSAPTPPAMSRGVPPAETTSGTRLRPADPRTARTTNVVSPPP